MSDLASEGPRGPRQPDIKSLFSAEAQIQPEPDELRERVLARARAALPRNQAFRLERSRSHGFKLGVAAAAAVVLFALGAAALQVGYRFKKTTPAPTSRVAASVAPASAESTSATPTVEAPTPAELESIEAPRIVKPKHVPAAKPASESEEYARELPVLQPALDAVARQDFSAALAAIAAHQRKFPSGQLAEEREGLRIKALVGLGRLSEAGRAASAFRERFPQSAMLGRIQEMLGTRP